MVQYCPNCGEPVADRDAFCSECGTSVDADDSGSSGWDDSQDSSWGDSQESGRDPQRSGWDNSRDTGRDPQNSGWEGGQGGPRRQQQGPPQGAGMQGGAGIPRKGALETFTQGLKWLVAVPALLGAFVVVELLSSLSPFVTGLLSLVGSILSLLLGAVAYKYTEQFVYSGDVQGGVDTVLSTASEVASRLLSLIGIAIIYVIAVFVGLFLLILPGIYLGARLVLAFPACVLDDEGVLDSFSTSWSVASGNILKLVGLGFILILANIGIGIVVSLGVAAAGGLSVLEGPFVSLLLAPVSAVLGGAVQIAIARVYLENRPPKPQPRGQQAGGYQQ